MAGTRRTSKKDFFRKKTLSTFLAGLKEELLGKTIRAMSTGNFLKAVLYILEKITSVISN